MEETKNVPRKVYGIYLPNQDDTHENFLRLANSVQECMLEYESEEMNKTSVLTNNGSIECVWCFQTSCDFVKTKNGDERMFQYFETFEDYQKEKVRLIEERIKILEKQNHSMIVEIIDISRDIEENNKTLEMLYASIGGRW